MISQEHITNLTERLKKALIIINESNESVSTINKINFKVLDWVEKIESAASLAQKEEGEEIGK